MDFNNLFQVVLFLVVVLALYVSHTNSFKLDNFEIALPRIPTHKHNANLNFKARQRSLEGNPCLFSRNGHEKAGLDPATEEYIQAQIEKKVEDFFKTERFQTMLSTHIQEALSNQGNQNEQANSSIADEYTDEDLIETRKLMEEFGASGLSKIDKRLMSGYVPALKRRKQRLIQSLTEGKGVHTPDALQIMGVLGQVSPLPHPAKQGRSLLDGNFQVLTSLDPSKSFGSLVPFDEVLKFSPLSLPENAKDTFEAVENVCVQKTLLEYMTPLNELDEEDFNPESHPLTFKVSHLFLGENNGMGGEVFYAGALEASPCGKMFSCTFHSMSIVLDKASAEMKQALKALGFKSVLNVWRPKKAIEAKKLYTISYLDQDLLLMFEKENESDSGLPFVCTKQED